MTTEITKIYVNSYFSKEEKQLILLWAKYNHIVLCILPSSSPGEGSGDRLQYSCLGNPMDGGAWEAAVHEVTKSRTRLSDFTFTFHFHAEWLHFHFLLSCIGKGNGTLLQCSCLENPRDGGAWWAAIYGVAQSRTRLKRLSSSSSSSSRQNIQCIYKVGLTLSWSFHTEK